MDNNQKKDHGPNILIATGVLFAIANMFARFFTIDFRTMLKVSCLTAVILAVFIFNLRWESQNIRPLHKWVPLGIACPATLIGLWACWWTALHYHSAKVDLDTLQWFATCWFGLIVMIPLVIIFIISLIKEILKHSDIY